MGNRENKRPKFDRRSLLKFTDLALGAAGAAAASNVSAAPPPEKKAEASGYSETDIVRTYYKLARV